MTINRDLRSGDKVVLDGSPFSPPMTVSMAESSRLGDGGKAQCTWIDEDGAWRCDMYPIAGLRTISDQECARLQKEAMQRKKAKDRIAWHDILIKWGTFIGAIAAAVFSIATVLK